MKSKIERIKDALSQHIAEAEKSTPGPWQNFYDRNRVSQTLEPYPDVDPIHEVCRTFNHNDGDFICSARTISPAMCKGLLVAIEAHQLVMSYRQQGSFDTSKQALAAIEAAFPEIP